MTSVLKYAYNQNVERSDEKVEVNNPRYLHQGIHVITSIFTVDKGVLKVLLVKRKNNPYKDFWALTGGALYNDEDLEDGRNREIYEKTGLKKIEVKFSKVFGKKDRSPVMRMIAISYIGIIDASKVEIAKDTLKTSNAEWFEITSIPKLAYDHNEIIEEAIKTLKEEILKTDLLKVFFPNGFTLPELQKVYESILGKKLDRRNFRKKMLSLDMIIPTEEEEKFVGKKKAKIYKFKI